MLETHTIYDEPEQKATAEPSGFGVITDIKEAVRDKNRVNVYIDNKFFCSLDIAQVVDLHVKIGRKIDEEERTALKRASDFSKFYARALEYALIRPRSQKEMRDYLKKKTLNRRIRVKDRRTGEYQTREKAGYDVSLVPLVFDRLLERGYLDDVRFAELWLENRHTSKGASIKKLRLELQQKGIAQDIIDSALAESGRDEREELKKMIERKRDKYADQQKLMQYLLRQGFNYSDIVDELSIESSSV